MNTSEAQIVEKSKRKSKPRVDHYSQNEAFAVMVFSLAVMLFFWLDELIGAVNFDGVEKTVTLGIAYLTPFIIAFLHHRWYIALDKWTCLGVTLLTATIIAMSPIWLFLGIFLAAIPYYFFPLATLLGIFSFITGIWLLARFMHLVLPRLLLILTAYSLLIFATFYGLGASSSHGFYGYTELGTASANGNNYVLNVYSGFNDPDRAVLYECNSFRFECSEILSYEHYNDLQLAKSEYDNVLVLVDGEVVFDSSEGGKE